MTIITKRIVLKGISMALVALMGALPGHAQSDGGRTAADFLLIGVGARAAGMGGAYTGVAEGANASYWNPAGLANTEYSEVSFGHVLWYQDMTVNNFAGQFQIGEKAAFGASMMFLNYGAIDGYDANGAVTGSISAYDWAGGLSFAYRLNDDLSMGVTGKYINQKLDDLSGSSFAVDAGLSYALDRVTFAAVASNFGSEIKFESVSEKLPSTVRFAVAAYPFGESILASAEIEKRMYGGMVVRNGFEFGFDKQYFLRAGYNYYPDEQDRTFGTGFAFGAGVKLNNLQFDYAYTLKEKYASEDLHRFSMSFAFGQ